MAESSPAGYARAAGEVHSQFLQDLWDKTPRETFRWDGGIQAGDIHTGIDFSDKDRTHWEEGVD